LLLLLLLLLLAGSWRFEKFFSQNAAAVEF
jgi:hypothetical protein